ncbi:hypothetical protein GQ42DRAFT_2108 [Ramicandelaber brevisporus]|nr:hypothetical protein GQ42DRAFT_2108 [Ramicandelaber brevisporus]
MAQYAIDVILGGRPASNPASSSSSTDMNGWIAPGDDIDLITESTTPSDSAALIQSSLRLPFSKNGGKGGGGGGNVPASIQREQYAARALCEYEAWLSKFCSHFNAMHLFEEAKALMQLVFHRKVFPMVDTKQNNRLPLSCLYYVMWRTGRPINVSVAAAAASLPPKVLRKSVEKLIKACELPALRELDELDTRIRAKVRLAVVAAVQQCQTGSDNSCSNGSSHATAVKEFLIAPGCSMNVERLGCEIVAFAVEHGMAVGESEDAVAAAVVLLAMQVAWNEQCQPVDITPPVPTSHSEARPVAVDGHQRNKRQRMMRLLRDQAARREQKQQQQQHLLQQQQDSPNGNAPRRRMRPTTAVLPYTHQPTRFLQQVSHFVLDCILRGVQGTTAATVQLKHTVLVGCFVQCSSVCNSFGEITGSVDNLSAVIKNARLIMGTCNSKRHDLTRDDNSHNVMGSMSVVRLNSIKQAKLQHLRSIFPEDAELINASDDSKVGQYQLSEEERRLVEQLYREKRATLDFITRSSVSCLRSAANPASDAVIMLDLDRSDLDSNDDDDNENDDDDDNNNHKDHAI